MHQIKQAMQGSLPLEQQGLRGSLVNFWRIRAHRSWGRNPETRKNLFRLARSWLVCAIFNQVAITSLPGISLEYDLIEQLVQKLLNSTPGQQYRRMRSRSWMTDGCLQQQNQQAISPIRWNGEWSDVAQGDEQHQTSKVLMKAHSVCRWPERISWTLDIEALPLNLSPFGLSPLRVGNHVYSVSMGTFKRQRCYFHHPTILHIKQWTMAF